MKKHFNIFYFTVIVTFLCVAALFPQGVHAQTAECNDKNFPHFFILDTTVRTVNRDPVTGGIKGYSILRNYSTTGQVQENWGVCNATLQNRLSRTGLKLSESNPIKNHQQILVEGECIPTKLCPGTYDETE